MTMNSTSLKHSKNYMYPCMISFCSRSCRFINGLIPQHAMNPSCYLLDANKMNVFPAHVRLICYHPRCMSRESCGRMSIASYVLLTRTKLSKRFDMSARRNPKLLSLGCQLSDRGTSEQPLDLCLSVSCGERPARGWVCTYIFLLLLFCGQSIDFSS